MGIRIQSTVPEEVEDIVTRIIGAAIEVHRRLGPGLSEGIYEDALRVELRHAQLRFDCQRKVVIEYRGEPLRPQRLDLVVEDCVIVEIKAVEMLLAVHKSQVVSYLRATGLRIGLLMNFNKEVLDVKRVIL